MSIKLEEVRNIDKLLVLVIVNALSFIPCSLFAQGLEVKEMKQVMSDLSGSVHQRVDSLGNPCGLVKVLIENPAVSFGGNVVGNVDNKMNETKLQSDNSVFEKTICISSYNDGEKIEIHCQSLKEIYDYYAEQQMKTK